MSGPERPQRSVWRQVIRPRVSRPLLAVLVATALAGALLTSCGSSGGTGAAKQSAPHSAVGTPLSQVAREAVVTGVVSKLASTTFGDVLSTVGLGDPVQQDVLATVKQIQAQLTQLQGTVDQISQQLTQASYDKWASEVIPIKNAVTDTYSRLQVVAQSRSKTGSTQVQDLIYELIKTHALVNLNSDLMGEASTTGAYRAWSNLLKSKSAPFWGPTQSNELFDYFDYYDTIQTQLLYLIREYDLATGLGQKYFDDTDLATFNTQRVAQQALRDSVKAAPTLIDQRTNLMWPTPLPGGHLVPYCAETLATLKGSVQVKCTGRSPLTVPNVSTRLAALNHDYSIDGFSDWRLPSVGEFRSLAAGQSNPRAYLQTQFGTDAVFAICDPVCRNIPMWTSDAGTLPPYGSVPAHQVFDVATNEAKLTPDYSAVAVVWPVRSTAGEKYWL